MRYSGRAVLHQKYKERKENQSRNIIDDYPRACRKPASQTIFAEVIGIYRNGFRPSEPDKGKAKKPHDIEMTNRIQSKPLIPLRRGISAFVS